MIEETWQVIQDFLAPELRAVSVRIETMERRLDGRIDGLGQRVEALEHRVDSLERRMDDRFSSLEVLILRQFQELKTSMEVDRRLSALENKFSEPPPKAS
ncbi:hypothetical protein [Silvibacterium sp.]|uniref:hypothetical protein n=1 Tax=Silvibacterium sp. TaxID=1964179 RepID=UPI0039E6D349